MSPQPAAAPEAKAEPESLHKALMDRIAAKVKKATDEKRSPTEDLTSAEKQVYRAQRLEAERAEVMKRIAANREYLRLMDDNEELTDAEADWLADFYPEKEKGQQRSDDEIERTRKVKAAARGK